MNLVIILWRGVDVRSWMKLCFMVNENGNIPVRRWEQYRVDLTLSMYEYTFDSKNKNKHFNFFW